MGEKDRIRPPSLSLKQDIRLRNPLSVAPDSDAGENTELSLALDAPPKSLSGVDISLKWAIFRSDPRRLGIKRSAQIEDTETRRPPDPNEHPEWANVEEDARR